jgi:hypothetical protein
MPVFPKKGKIVKRRPTESSGPFHLQEKGSKKLVDVIFSFQGLARIMLIGMQ